MCSMFLAMLALLFSQFTFADTAILKEKCRDLAYGPSNVRREIARENTELFSECNEVYFINLKLSTKARSSAEKKLLRNNILGDTTLKELNYRLVDEVTGNENFMSVEAAFDSYNESCSVKIVLNFEKTSIRHPSSKSNWGMNISDCLYFVKKALEDATKWVLLPPKLKAP